MSPSGWWRTSSDSFEAASLGEVLRKGLRQGRQHLQCVAHDAVVRKVEDRRVRVGVDATTITSEASQPTRC